METPFEVVHIDSHADLGLGYLSWTYILDEEKFIWDKPVENTIQLVCNPDMEFPSYNADEQEKQAYLKNAVKEPEVPLLIIPSIQDVKYNGDFDFVVMAQSPNYTPASADFIMDIVREYIVEI